MGGRWPQSWARLCFLTSHYGGFCSGHQPCGLIVSKKIKQLIICLCLRHRWESFRDSWDELTAENQPWWRGHRAEALQWASLCSPLAHWVGGLIYWVLESLKAMLHCFFFCLFVCLFRHAKKRSHGLWDLSYPTRHWTWVQAVKVPSPNRWTARELPKSLFWARRGLLLNWVLFSPRWRVRQMAWTWTLLSRTTRDWILGLATSWHVGLIINLSEHPFPHLQKGITVSTSLDCRKKSASHSAWSVFGHPGMEGWKIYSLLSEVTLSFPAAPTRWPSQRPPLPRGAAFSSFALGSFLWYVLHNEINLSLFRVS